MATSSSNQFSDKVAIVTGSNSGIGEAIALHYASRGAKLTLCGRDVTRLQQSLAKCVEASGGHADRFLTMPGDLTDKKYRLELVEKTVETFGALDILVCNAGIADPLGGIDNSTEESFDNLVNVNLKSVFFLIQAALSHLELSKGNVVVVSTSGTIVADSPMVVYPMVKAGLDHMTRCLALDLAPRGIRLNTVNPTAILTTRILRDVTSTDEGKSYVDAFAAVEAKQQPLGNRMLKVEEVAEAVAFLSSGQASFVTGQNLVVDGGRTLNGPYLTKPDGF